MNQRRDRKAERHIVRVLVRDALAAGYRLNVNNGGDEHEFPTPQLDAATVLDALFATDSEHLFFYLGCGKRVGYVWLIHGNAPWEVIADYTTNLEPVLAGANAAADAAERRAR